MRSLVKSQGVTILDLSRQFSHNAGDAVNEHSEEEWFSLFHYGEKIADFCIEGDTRWVPSRPEYQSLFTTVDGKAVPNFVRNLFPEGWLESQVLGNPNQEHTQQKRQRTYLSGGYKFLSNFTIVKKTEMAMIGVSLDHRLDTLANYVDSRGKFIGKSSELAGSSASDDFSSQLAKYWQNRQTARYSGAELKTPQCLFADGQLRPAIMGAPFNVFLKYAGRDENNSLGLNEFMGLSMAKAVGLETPAFCVIEQPDGLPPVFGIERYDIPYGMPHQESRRLITQDFVTLMGKKPDEKGMGSIEQVGKCIREISDRINPDKTMDSLEKLFTRAVLAWVANDGDMHLKNISLLMEYDPKDGKYTRAVFSPSYDITSDIEHEQYGRKQLLTIAGSGNKLKMSHFINLANSLGLYGKDKGKIEETVRDIAEKAALKAVEIYHNPPIENLPEDIRYDMSVITSHAVDRAKALGVNGLAWDSAPVWADYKKNSIKARRANKPGRKLTVRAQARRDQMFDAYM